MYIFLFIGGMVLGGLLEYLLTFLVEFLERKPLKINHKFSIAKRVSLFSLPIWGLITLLFAHNSSHYVQLFLYSAFIGTFFEWALGKGFHKIFGIKLWTYKYGGIGKFTSIYSLPYWGVGGLVFVTLSKILGF